MQKKNKEFKDVVREGYDTVSHLYRGDEEGEGCLKYHAWLDLLEPLLPESGDVLDLGCGNGVPVARRLEERFRFTGVDISPVQIERAGKNVPSGHFICSDMSALAFPVHSFDAVLSFYAIIHVPLDEQQELFQRVCRWLRPGGYFMATLGTEAWTGEEGDWLGGAPMYWSHADQETYLQWLRGIGFRLLSMRFIPEGCGGHTLFLMQR